MYESLTEAMPALVAQLKAFGAGKRRDLVIAGHSLGASLSGLAAARLAAEAGLHATGAAAVAAVAPSGDRGLPRCCLACCVSS